MDLLKCHECNYEAKQLHQHIKNVHNMSVIEYKQKHGNDLKMQVVTNEQCKMRKDIALNGGSNRRMEYWLKRGYTPEQAIAKISAVQKNNSSYRKYEPTEIILNTEYWIRKHGYSIEEANHKIHKIQSERSSRSSKFLGKSHTKESRNQISINMSKHIKNVGIEEWVGHFGKFTGRSNKEIEIYEYIKNNICHAMIANPWICGWVPDMIYKNKIIEFNGDYWHANPAKYKSTDKIKFPGNNNIKEAHEIWNKDHIRITDFISGGYDVLIIWEHDWDNSRDIVYDTIQNFLKDA